MFSTPSFAPSVSNRTPTVSEILQVQSACFGAACYRLESRNRDKLAQPGPVLECLPKRVGTSLVTQVGWATSASTDLGILGLPGCSRFLTTSRCQTWPPISLFIRVRTVGNLRGIRSNHEVDSEGSISSLERSQLLSQNGATIWFTGLSASGKVGGGSFAMEIMPHFTSQPLHAHWSSTCCTCESYATDWMEITFDSG